MKISCVLFSGSLARCVLCATLFEYINCDFAGIVVCEQPTQGFGDKHRDTGRRLDCATVRQGGTQRDRERHRETKRDKGRHRETQRDV